MYHIKVEIHKCWINLKFIGSYGLSLRIGSISSPISILYQPINGEINFNNQLQLYCQNQMIETNQKCSILLHIYRQNKEAKIIGIIFLKLKQKGWQQYAINNCPDSKAKIQVKVNMKIIELVRKNENNYSIKTNGDKCCQRLIDQLNKVDTIQQDNINPFDQDSVENQLPQNSIEDQKLDHKNKNIKRVRIVQSAIRDSTESQKISQDQLSPTLKKSKYNSCISKRKKIPKNLGGISSSYNSSMNKKITLQKINNLEQQNNSSVIKKQPIKKQFNLVKSLYMESEEIIDEGKKKIEKLEQELKMQKTMVNIKGQNIHVLLKQNSYLRQLLEIQQQRYAKVQGFMMNLNEIVGIQGMQTQNKQKIDGIFKKQDSILHKKCKQLEQISQELYIELQDVQNNRDKLLEQCMNKEIIIQERSKCIGILEEKLKKIRHKLQDNGKQRETEEQIKRIKKEKVELKNKNIELERKFKETFKAILEFKNDAMKARQEIMSKDQQIERLQKLITKVSSKDIKQKQMINIGIITQKFENISQKQKQKLSITPLNSTQYFTEQKQYLEILKMLENSIEERKILQKELSSYYQLNNKNILNNDNDLFIQLQKSIDQIFLKIFKTPLTRKSILQAKVQLQQYIGKLQNKK